MKSFWTSMISRQALGFPTFLVSEVAGVDELQPMPTGEWEAHVLKQLRWDVSMIRRRPLDA